MRRYRIIVPVVLAALVVAGVGLERARAQAPKEVLIGILLLYTIDTTKDD